MLPLLAFRHTNCVELQKNHNLHPKQPTHIEIEFQKYNHIVIVIIINLNCIFKYTKNPKNPHLNFNIILIYHYLCNKLKLNSVFPPYVTFLFLTLAYIILFRFISMSGNVQYFIFFTAKKNLEVSYERKCGKRNQKSTIKENASQNCLQYVIIYWKKVYCSK